METLNTEKTELEDYMQSGNYINDELLINSNRLSELKIKLDEKEMRWLELSENM